MAIRIQFQRDAGVSSDTAKQAARLLVTSDTDGVRAYIASARGFLPPSLEATVRSITRARPAIMAGLHARGFHGNVPRTVDRNAMHYALEAIEGYVMRLWITKIYARQGSVSCLLRGDGIWISADTPAGLVMHAFKEAATQAGFPDLEARAADLSAAARGLAPPSSKAYRANADEGLGIPGAEAAEPTREAAPFLDWLRFQPIARWLPT